MKKPNSSRRPQSSRLLRDKGQYLPLPSVEEALAYPYSDAERAYRA